MNIIGRKNLFFVISLLVIIPGLISLFLYGLKLSIDFSGGSRVILTFPKTVDKNTTDTVSSVISGKQIAISSLQPSGKQIVLRTATIDEKKDIAILADLRGKIPGVKQESYETIGPTISSEITVNAFKAIILASVLIVLYIAWAFRTVPKPASSWRFGLCAIVALIHDVLVVVGVFSILGHFFNVEVDSLFVTAILTVIGFSVHDTIVVFDRIRENLRRIHGLPFAVVVNESILQTLGRSLNTSLTVVLVLFSLLLFGGESTRWFVVALLIGIVSGTYSSIFNAAPLLVLWEELRKPKV